MNTREPNTTWTRHQLTPFATAKNRQTEYQNLFKKPPVTNEDTNQLNAEPTPCNNRRCQKRGMIEGAH